MPLPRRLTGLTLGIGGVICLSQSCVRPPCPARRSGAVSGARAAEGTSTSH